LNDFKFFAIFCGQTYLSITQLNTIKSKNT